MVKVMNKGWHKKELKKEEIRKMEKGEQKSERTGKKQTRTILEERKD